MVTKGHIGVNSSMLLIFSQVRSSVAVGTPDYISPEILQVCTPTTLGLQCSGWEYFKKQPCPSWNACWIAPKWKKLQNLSIFTFITFYILGASTILEPCLTTALFIWRPRYYGHSVLFQTKAQSVIFLCKEPFNTAVPLIWPDLCMWPVSEWIDGAPL